VTHKMSMLIPVKRLVNCVSNVVQQAFNLHTTSSMRSDFLFSLTFLQWAAKRYLRRINCLGNSSKTFSNNVEAEAYEVTRLNGVRTKQRASMHTHSFSVIDGRLKSIFPSSQSRQLVIAMSGNCRLYGIYYLLIIIT
jgi:hypothetical protein